MPRNVCKKLRDVKKKSILYNLPKLFINQAHMKQKNLGELKVSSLGLGCMSMSEFYGPTSLERSKQTFHEAIEHGITFFDTADMYGSGHNELFLQSLIKPFRSTIQIATKFGIMRKAEDPLYRKINGKPEYVRKQCEESLIRLGIDTIDLYYQHRVDPETPIEETVHAMAKLVQEGKVRYIGLSEASPDMILRAHAVHPITALQSEYSLWYRDPEQEILPLCQKLHIGFVAYSPIGRGFLSGKFRSTEDLHPTDFRRTLPRFQEKNLDQNLQVVHTLEKMANKKKCTSAQLALAWMAHKNPSIVPLFGTTSPTHLIENIQSLQVGLTDEDIRLLDTQIPIGFAQGDRYSSDSMKLYKMDR